MLLSHSHRFIFVHIYKTAGTSVMSAFLPYARVVDRLIYEFELTRRAFGAINYLLSWTDGATFQFTGFHKHATAGDALEAMGSKRYEAYYSFAFTRNSFDWLVSLYY